MAEALSSGVPEGQVLPCLFLFEDQNICMVHEDSLTSSLSLPETFKSSFPPESVCDSEACEATLAVHALACGPKVAATGDGWFWALGSSPAGDLCLHTERGLIFAST